MSVCRRNLVTSLLTLSLAACGTTSSALATGPRHAPFQGDVRVVLVERPTGATELGEVEVSSQRSMREAVDAFRARVAELGGDVAWIERYATLFDTQMVGVYDTGQCGNDTCPTVTPTPQRIVQLRLTGKALRSAGSEP